MLHLFSTNLSVIFMTSFDSYHKSDTLLRMTSFIAFIHDYLSLFDPAFET